jgi:crotonobetainyl-CoA:carnitine CoA-transferase CaiB-like acyl-CoA transferase
MSSVVAVLLALAHRDRTGEGQEVWTSLLNAALYGKSDVHLTEDGVASESPRVNQSQTGLGPLYRLYETQDGWLQVAAVKERHWPVFCDAVGQPGLATDPRFAGADQRYRNRLVLEALLEPVFRTQTAIQWRRRFDAVGVPSEISANTVDGELVLFDEDNLRLGVVSETRHATAGRLRQVGNLMSFSETPSTVLRPPPVSGEHTLEIVRWLGYDDATVDDYLQRRIIATD